MSLGNRFIMVGILYLFVGMSMGIMMGASRDFTLHGVHAHINLIGWVSMVLFGLIYRSIPGMNVGKLGNVHFWVSNVSLVIMMVTLTMVVKGNTSVVPVLAASEIALVISVVIFAGLFWKNRNA